MNDIDIQEIKKIAKKAKKKMMPMQPGDVSLADFRRGYEKMKIVDKNKA